MRFARTSLAVAASPLHRIRIRITLFDASTFTMAMADSVHTLLILFVLSLTRAVQANDGDWYNNWNYTETRTNVGVFVGDNRTTFRGSGFIQTGNNEMIMKRKTRYVHRTRKQIHMQQQSHKPRWNTAST